VDAQIQRDSTQAGVVGAVAGDGHRAVHGHLVLFAVLCYVERVWRELKRERETLGFSYNGSQTRGFRLEEKHSGGMLTFSPA